MRSSLFCTYSRMAGVTSRWCPLIVRFIHTPLKMRRRDRRAMTLHDDDGDVARTNLQGRTTATWVLQRFAQADGRNFQGFAVLGDGTPRDDHALFPQHLRNLAVG